MKYWQPDELTIEPELCQQIVRHELAINKAMRLVNDTVDIVRCAITAAMGANGGNDE